ncbi:MAG: thioredoxin domain-containing protein [Acidobacteriota bacterium]|nr:thioredoxin domain-containing protein [Acidobacteriota bacterium]
MKIKLLTLIAVLAMSLGTAWAAGPSSALQPPAGHRMALVVFEDLECPACATADPTLVQAVRDYGVALVRHDFVIPNHPWSKEAHIMARYFDKVNPQLGEEFRQYIFANQQQIFKANLRQWADRFAGAHRTALPAFYDPDGSLRAKVEADTVVGRNLNVHLTPTIWVVTNSPQVPPVEITERAKLFETIEHVKAQLPAEKASAEKKTHRK